MRNGRPKAALHILLLALFVLTGPGAPANQAGSSFTNATTTTATPTIATTITNITTTNNTNTTTSTSTVLRNLTIGYLTAAKGSLDNRQGLSISGALTLALKEVSGNHVSKRAFLLFVQKKKNNLLIRPKRACVYVRAKF